MIACRGHSRRRGTHDRHINVGGELGGCDAAKRVASMRNTGTVALVDTLVRMEIPLRTIFILCPYDCYVLIRILPRSSNHDL